MYKYDLSDFTFIIPIRVDTSDRIDNVLIVVKYITNYFSTNILILEADGFQHLNTETFPIEVEYCFIKDEKDQFHRTHYINEMIKRSRTTYIGIWDVDVIIPIQQIIESVLLLKKRKCFVVIPYDGSCYGLNYYEKVQFGNTLNLETLKGELYAEHACGGALMIDKESFLEAGMCNEYLTSWGPDDVEQRKRLEILGYEIKRISGGLYHLPHSKGINSGYYNYEERIRLIGEYVKVASMTRGELKKYIDTWPWKTTIKKKNSKRTIVTCKQVTELLEKIKIKTPQLGLYDGITGVALELMWLFEKTNKITYQEQAHFLLNELTKKVQAKNVSQDLLAGIGRGVLFMLNQYKISFDHKYLLETIDGLLFDFLYLKQMNDLSKKNGIVGIVSYFLDVITKGQPYRAYASVFYEEYLIYLTDEMGRLLHEKYAVINNSDLMRSCLNSKEIADCLLIYEKLKNISVNQEAISRNRQDLIYFSERYLNISPVYTTDDIWILYAYIRISGNDSQCKNEYHKWLEKWCYKRRFQDCSFIQIYLYQFCLNRGNEIMTDKKPTCLSDLFLVQDLLL